MSSTPVILRIRQQGYVRATGYQASQWVVTVPTSEGSDPPLATEPETYAPLFVLRNVGGFERFERVAKLEDFVGVPRSELTCFDVRGAGGDLLLLNASAGDVLRITTEVPHWIQAQAPYTDQDFIVSHVAFRAQGTGAICFTDGQVQLPGYVFSEADIGRWVRLQFRDTSNNGYAQILSYTGNTARVGRRFSSLQGDGTWAFPWVRIRDSFEGLEPRYFPTCERNLAWDLRRDDGLLVTGTGGVTAREIDAALVRSIRATTLTPTLDAATNLFTVTRSDVSALQRAAARTNSVFTALITHTVGP